MPIATGMPHSVNSTAQTEARHSLRLFDTPYAAARACASMTSGRRSVRRRARRPDLNEVPLEGGESTELLMLSVSSLELWPALDGGSLSGQKASKASSRSQ